VTGVPGSECMCDIPPPVLLPDPVSLSHHSDDFLVHSHLQSLMCNLDMIPVTKCCRF